jgi:hypothetical protein
MINKSNWKNEDKNWIKKLNEIKCWGTKKIIKNDWSQPSSTFRTCDTNYKTGSQHKKKT